MLSLKDAVIAIFGCGAVVFLTRVFPFLLFSKREPPAALRFIEKHLPPMVMAVLLIYCLRNIRFAPPLFSSENGIPQLAALVVTAALHVWKGNAMISIFSATAFYMALITLL
ncbi:MAG: branched-chain amino acid transporter permease [Treponemataceae bacterium]|nr:MAG: branched-chain amino acid transporter permease [Treponemataceae bacterium]